MTHSNLINQALVNGSKIPGTRLYSNPVGFAYNFNRVVKKYHKNGKNYIILEGYRPVTYGLTKGSSDIIGFHSVNNLPIFTAIDAKTGKDDLKPHQRKFQDMVLKFGGFAGVLRKEEDLYKILHT